MTPNQILIVAIRLLAVFWALSAVRDVMPSIATFNEMSAPVTSFWVVLGVQLALAAWLWTFPGIIAGRLLRGGTRIVAAAETQPGNWEAFGFILVGILVAARALPDLIYWLIMLVAPEPIATDFTFEQKAGMFSTLAELVLGLWLLFGSAGIAAVVRHYRYGERLLDSRDKAD